MIEKIISSGQSGASLAALDVAINLNIPYGGWISRGRITEHGRLPDLYRLKEVDSFSYAARTEQNILEADGTLIITRGPLTRGNAFARQTALVNARPCHHSDLNRDAAFPSAQKTTAWISEHRIRALHVTGTRESEDPTIYQSSRELLEAVFYLHLIESNSPNPFQPISLRDELIELSQPPHTVEEAVERLLKRLPMKEKMRLASAPEKNLRDWLGTLGYDIINQFKLWGNSRLKASCSRHTGGQEMDQETAAMVIIRSLRLKLNKEGTHCLKVVK